MATCCRQLCPRITSCSGWPVSGHGERNALSSPLTFRSLYFLFHSARSWLGRMGGESGMKCRGKGGGGPGWRVWGIGEVSGGCGTTPHTLQNAMTNCIQRLWNPTAEDTTFMVIRNAVCRSLWENKNFFFKCHILYYLLDFHLNSLQKPLLVSSQHIYFTSVQKFLHFFAIKILQNWIN